MERRDDERCEASVETENASCSARVALRMQTILEISVTIVETWLAAVSRRLTGDVPEFMRSRSAFGCGYEGSFGTFTRRAEMIQNPSFKGRWPPIPLSSNTCCPMEGALSRGKAWDGEGKCRRRQIPLRTDGMTPLRRC
jgi:hypothetical protein